MKQFLLPRTIEPGQSLELRGADFHYLHRVRRLKKGDQLVCRTPGGALLHCKVVDISNASLFISAAIDVQQPAEAQSEQNSVPARGLLHLVQCVPKGKKLDLIARQSVELGVARISLIESRNSVPDLSERWEKKRLRLEAVQREAYQQSGAGIFPVIEEPCSFSAFIEKYPLGAEDLGLFFHEQQLEKSSLHGYLEPIPREIRMIIGPEGGLSPEELLLLETSGYRPVYLGKQVLRCETAAVVGLGALALIVREYPFWSAKDSKSHDE